MMPTKPAKLSSARVVEVLMRPVVGSLRVRVAPGRRRMERRMVNEEGAMLVLYQVRKAVVLGKGP
jgi:hypothetical protein